MTSHIQVSIQKKKMVTVNTTEVVLGLQNSFDFQAGQYIELKLPNLLYDDPKGNYRIFSLASSPNDKKELSIAFRDSESGFKKSLRELPLGSIVEIEGPFGYLTLPSNDSIPLVFVAGGIGITPFLSIIRYAYEEKIKNRISLIYFNKDKKSAAYHSELEKLSREYQQLSVRPIFGSFDPMAIRGIIKNPEENLWYIAGPPFMVSECAYTLSGMNVESNHILSEEYIGYE